MSARENMSASPYIISKSILKHPIRETRGTPYSQQSKHKNLRLFINKKHSELQALHGLSSRNHAIAFISGQLSNQAEMENQASTDFYKPIDFEKDLDPVSKQAYEHIQATEYKDMFYVESLPAIQKNKLKKGKSLTRDQRLRAHIYGSIGPDIVGKLYDRYTDKRKEYEITRLKEAETVNVRKLIGMNSKLDDKPEDYFVVQTLQQQGFNAAQLLDVGELKTKEIEVESPKGEGDKELDEIVERNQEKSRDKKLYVKRKEEERQVIELSKIGSAVGRHSTQAQIHRFNGYFKDVEAVYTMQEKRMKEAREEQVKQSSVKFVRQDETVADRIEEKARASLARLFKEHKDRDRKDRSNNNSTTINNSNNSLSPSRYNNKSKESFSISSHKEPRPVLQASDKASISSLSEANFRLKSENETKALIQVYYEGGTARSKSMPKVVRNVSIGSPILIEASDSSFGQSSKILPYVRESPIEQVDTQIDTSKGSIEKMQKTAADTPELRAIDDKAFITRSPSLLQHSLVLPENSSPCLSAARSIATSERVLVAKKTLPAITLSSARGSSSRRGSILQNGMKKLLKPLEDIKQKLQAFQEDNEEFFVQSERDNKSLVEKINKTRKDLDKEYKQIQKSTTRGLGMNSEEMIQFANKQNFKKEVVSKIVASIENKEEALHAIQKKRYLADMNIRVAKAMEF